LSVRAPTLTAAVLVAGCAVGCATGCATVPGPVAVGMTLEAQQLEARRHLPAHLAAVGQHATRITGCDGLELRPVSVGPLRDEDDNERVAVGVRASGCGRTWDYLSTCPPLPGLEERKAPAGQIVCRVQRRGGDEQSAEGGTLVTDLGTDYIVDDPDGTTMPAQPTGSPLPEPLSPYADDEE
jgi:hypothetical protein